MTPSPAPKPDAPDMEAAHSLADLILVNWNGTQRDENFRNLARAFLALKEDLRKASREWNEQRRLLNAAEAQAAKLREALRFYADPGDRKDADGDTISVPDFYDELDFGETARAALSPSAPAEAGSKCPRCNGEGEATNPRGADHYPIGCPDCGGTGWRRAPR